MSDGLMIGDRAAVQRFRPSKVFRRQPSGLLTPERGRLLIRTWVKAELFRGYRKIWEDEGENLVVDAGINWIFANDIEAATLYLGLKDTGTVSAGDTMASHGGWSELTNYDEATREAYTEDGSTTDEKVSNSGSPAQFTMNTTDDIYGAFLTTDSTKGGTGGTLIGAKDFSAAVSVVDNDVLNVTYEIAGSSS